MRLKLRVRLEISQMKTNRQHDGVRQLQALVNGGVRGCGRGLVEDLETARRSAPPGANPRPPQSAARYGGAQPRT